MSEERPDWMLDSARAAAYCGLSVATMAKLRCTGGGPEFTKAGPRGGKVLYAESALKKWLKAKRYKSTSEYGARAPRA